MSAAACLALALPLLAPPLHDDLDVAIANVTARIAAAPSEAALYVSRGDLLRQKREWNAALADLERAEALDGGRIELRLVRARVFADLGWHDAALAAIDNYLAARPGDGEALAQRARALADKGLFGAAREAWEVALAALEPPRTEHYLGRAAAWVGEPAAALAGLDGGIARLGRVPALVEAALSLELEMGRTDAALARIDAELAAAPRSAPWLARRGDVLAGAGRRADAAAAYSAALAAIAALKPARRNTGAMQALGAELRAKLAQLDGA